MKTPRPLAGSAILAAFTCLSPGSAAVIVLSHSYNEAAFAKAQTEDRRILIESYAGWCPPCHIQAPIIADLLRDGDYADTVLFRLSEDTPNTVWKKFRLKSYSALIVYRGTREIDRAIGATDREQIEKLLASAGKA